VSNLQELFNCDGIDLGSIFHLIEFASKEARVDFDLFSPAIVEIAMPSASFEEKHSAACVGSRAIFFCVTHLCLKQLVESVGNSGAINDSMLSACVALEAFEEQFVKTGVIDAAEGSMRVQLETVMEKTKRQVTIKFNALFEEVVKAESFSNLSQVDGSSSSSNDMCALLTNLTKNFVSAKVPIDHRWWDVPTHVMMSIIDRYIEFNAATGDVPSPILPKVVHKTGALSMFKSSDAKVVVPKGRRPSQYEFPDQVASRSDGMTLWGPPAEHARLTGQRMEELVARYCNMEKVAEFLTSLEEDLRSSFGQSDEEYALATPKIRIACSLGVDSVDRYAVLRMAVEMQRLLERVQSRKKKVLGYLSHKIVMFDLYEPLCDRLFAPDPSQKNPVARPFRITPLLTEYVFRLKPECSRFLFPSPDSSTLCSPSLHPSSRQCQLTSSSLLTPTLLV
jgi:hypothetical protein